MNAKPRLIQITWNDTILFGIYTKKIFQIEFNGYSVKWKIRSMPSRIVAIAFENVFFNRWEIDNSKTLPKWDLLLQEEDFSLEQ